MKILIFGNIASGKSTLIDKLKIVLSDFEIIAIDDFRKCYGNGSMEYEKYAKQRFLEAIVPCKNQIIEAMGTGNTGKYLFEKLSVLQEHNLVVILQTPLSVCQERLKQRKWDIPYPAPTKQAFILAEETDKKIISGSLATFWRTLNKCLVYEIKNYDETIIVEMIKKYRKSYEAK